MLMRDNPTLVIGVLGLLIVVNFLFFYLLKQPTLAGRKVMDQIEGFKMYLTTAEGAELAQAALGKTPQLYERLLPYAIALGVENRWAEQFSDVLRAAAQDAGAAGGGSYHPSWYSGNSFDGMDATRFTSALSSSLSSSIASSSTAPGSSSGQRRRRLVGRRWRRRLVSARRSLRGGVQALQPCPRGTRTSSCMMTRSLPRYCTRSRTDHPSPL